jgi:TonB-linked SusC/RagA family outer membrane protein
MQTQEAAIKSVMKIVLKNDSEVLDEVMVVAFGTAKKSSFTGAATVVGAEELSKHVTTNVANALVGSTPGLQLRGGSGAPGASQGSIKIRGIASMYADTDPLIVVDGAPYSASLSNIPQEDIESVTVLKDAASAALYGARGAAGVILVTTKSGKNKQAQVNVDVKWGANSRAVQDYETISDPGQYYETVYGQYYNYYYYGRGLDAATANASANNTMLNHLGYNIYTVPDGEYLIGANGKLNPNATLGRTYEANGETYYMTADNWHDAAYKTALRQEYNVSVTGSSDKGSFYASMGYLDEDGVIEFSGYNRLSARLKADYQAKKWLKLGANVSYVNSKTESNPNMGTAWNSANLMYYTTYIGPIYPIYVRVLDTNGNPTIRTDANGNPQYDYGVAATNYPGITRTFLSTGNPLGSNRYNESLTKGNKLNGNFTVDINFTDFLKFNATSTLDWGNTNASYLDNMLYGSKVSVNGQIDKRQTNTVRQNHVQTLTYFDQFGKHNVNVMLGHEYYDINTSYLRALGQGLFSQDIPELNAAAKTVESNSYSSEYNVEGYFGSVQYNYDDKYFGSASYRRDASSRFAKANRWGNFWSVGGAWLISKEKWCNASWIDQLKLKASIGQQGNDNIEDYAYTDLYDLTASSDTNMSASFARLGNSDITWETTTNFNVGLEFSLFGNRLSGSIDYYNKKTTDLLFWLSVPESAGTRGYYDNIGDIRNSGIELSLQGTLIHTKDVDWTVQYNISHNSDKILKLPDSKKELLGGFVSSRKWYKEGGSLYNYMLPEYAGPNEKGEATYWVDAELGEGVTNRPGKNHSYTTTNPNNATQYEQGSSLPDVYGGFGTSISFYGFDASVTFDYQIGGQVMDYVYQSLMSNNAEAKDAGAAVHKDILKSWTPNNTSSSIPRYQYGDQYTVATSNRWMTNASYLNFQSFTVGYTLPKKLLTAYGISKLRVYATGENLCFWSARKGFDPRYSYGATETVNVYSPVRTIMGGIQLTF